MTTPVRAKAHPKSATVPTDGSDGPATQDMPLQSLQCLLSGLQKIEHAQVKMVLEFGEDLLTTSRMLTSGIDARDWLQVPTTLAGTGVRHLVTAQAAMLSAWTEMQSVALEQMRASLGQAQRFALPDRSEGPVGEQASHANAAWMEDVMKTYARFFATSGAAWAPQSAGTPTRH